jgi:hypothetical protein
VTPENVVKDALMRVLLRDFPQGFWFSSPASAYGRAGKPDFSGVCEGYACYFETKANARKYGPTPTQAKFGRSVIAAGGFWLVCDDAENASRLLNAFLVNKRREARERLADGVSRQASGLERDEDDAARDDAERQVDLTEAL